MRKDDLKRQRFLNKKKSKSKFKKQLKNIRRQGKQFKCHSPMKKRVLIVRNKFRKDTNLINQVVFPILTLESDGTYKFLATGFFINENGWFVTAKHVVMEVVDYQNSEPFSNLVVIQVINETEYIQRPVHAFFTHPNADIVVGQLFPISLNDQQIDNPALIIKLEEAKVGDEIFTYGYPDSKVERNEDSFQIASFSPDYYHGNITGIEIRNDRLLVGKSIQANILVKGGASGGPVFDSKGYVIGVNSTGYDLPEGEEPISFITPFEYALEIEVPFNDGKQTRQITLRDLVDLGGIYVKK